MSHGLPTPPTTPIKQILSAMVRDDKNRNLLHFRVPSHFVSSNGRDSIFAWLDQRKYIWRHTDNSRAGSHHYLDIRRPEDPPLDDQTSQEDFINSFANALPPNAALSDENAVGLSWNVTDSTELPHSTKLRRSGSHTSLFSEASDDDPVASSSTQPAQLCLPPGGKLVFPKVQLSHSSNTVAPKDIFSPMHPSPALPPSHRLQPQSKNPVASGSRRAHNVQKFKKRHGSDDSDFHASDRDGSDGEDGSEFDATSSKGRRQKSSRSGGPPNAKTPLYCEFPGCSFVQRNGRAVDLNRHSETHKNPETRPKYECDMCGHVVSRKDALRRHQEQSCKANADTVKRPRKKRAGKTSH